MIPSLHHLSLDESSSPSPPASSPPSPLLPLSSVARTPPEIWRHIIRLTTRIPGPTSRFRSTLEAMEAKLGAQQEMEAAKGNKEKENELNILARAFTIAANMFTCSLVCREWNDLATPLLYKFVTLRGYKLALSFIRTIHSNPSLGNLVDEVEIAVTPRDEERL